MVQAVTLILCKPKTPMVSNRKARVRFWIVVAVQAIAGSGLFWLALGGPK
jgi:hypothetical protein